MNGKSLLQKLTEKRVSTWNILFKKPWPYWFGGVLLAVVNIIYFAISGEIWSITSGFARLGAWIISLFGVNVETWEAWQYYQYNLPWLDNNSWSNLGIIIGALIAILLAGQFKLKKIKNKKQIITVLIGGWLMGYGARIAIGCNIGGLYTALASLALNGWLYLPFIILGIYFGSKVLIKLINY
ncbi:YeeE/YedE family protein [Halanaerobium sp. Z-7514]|uniref:YeeE/YedE family protein n=1 Tax=Halanaerobium polyolivorans TaxID=2886943 RepID=A0AAW4WZN3_9FIRM|nr:YeeE/YedE family protein [Halanaerobium polyolivorans]RQD79022.1 MAG: YeeE/YedE family protein [Halanaerobium sp. MSAO_Bac5]